MSAEPEFQPDQWPDSSVNPRLTPNPRRCACPGCRPKRPKRVKENPEYMKSLRAMIRQTVVRIGGQGDVEGLADLVGLRDELEKAIASSVDLLHEQDFSWTEIGRVLKISRQAAQQRYGGRSR